MEQYSGGANAITLLLLLLLLPYILKPYPHPFYSFRGLKNQMRTRSTFGLDLRS